MILRKPLIFAFVGTGATAIALALVVWAVWPSSAKVQAGPGPFTEELLLCREALDQDIQHIDQVHLDETVWHQGDAEELRIGGKVQLQGDDGRPAIHNYECLSRRERIIRMDVW